MTYEIRTQAVRGVVSEAMQALGGKGFTHAEIIIGLGEVVGRMIVNVAETPIQAAELVTVVHQHLTRTIEAGQRAHEKTLILPEQ